MLKCEKCGATVPNESRFCLNCGNRMDSSAPKHFSLDEIARQQQEQESGAFSITPEVPDDDPDSYLPPIGAKEHSEIPKGEIDPEYFNHKPLPSIQAADPLELLDADTPELPPIGFSDQMQIEDFKMPEGIRHYHGSYAVPRNLQMQTAIPIAENGDTYNFLVQAQKKRQMTDQQAHGDKEHFSVIPQELQIGFRKDTDVSEKACSFNSFFIDEYDAKKDIPPAKKPAEAKRPVKKLNVKPARKQIAVKQPAKKQTETKPPVVQQTKPSLSKTPPPKIQEQPKVSLEKAVPPEQTVPAVTLEKSVPPPPPAPPKVSLEKAPVEIPEAAVENSVNQQPKVSLEKAPSEIPQATVENSVNQQPKVTLEKTPPQNNFNFQPSEPPKNDFNFQSPEPPKNDFNFQPPQNEQPQNDFNNYMFSAPQNDFNNQMFSDSNSNLGSQSGFGGYNSNPSMSYRSNGSVKITSSYVPSTFDKAMIISGLVLFVLRAVLLVVIMVSMVSVLTGSISPFDMGGLSDGSNAGSVSVSVTDKESAKWANLNSGGLAAEDDEGNIYYTDSKGCLCKSSASGNSKSVIYNGSRTNNYILYINFHNDRLYFLASVTGKSYSICSVDKYGKNLKIYSEAKEPACVMIYGDYIYYITEDTKKVERISLKTEKAERFYNASGTVTNIFFSGDKMYVLVIGDTDYGGKVETVNVAAPSAVSSVNFTYSSGSVEPMNMCINGDRIIMADNSKYSPGVVYSAALDGSDVKQLGGSNILKVSGYGNYIYYSYINGSLKNAAAAVSGGNMAGLFNLGMMSTDGSSTYNIKDDVVYYSLAGNRIYYLSGDSGMFSMTLNGTDVKAVT